MAGQVAVWEVAGQVAVWEVAGQVAVGEVAGQVAVGEVAGQVAVGLVAELHNHRSLQINQDEQSVQIVAVLAADVFGTCDKKEH